MTFNPDTSYQPFEVVWDVQNEVYSVFCNKGRVHGFFKPSTQIEVSSLKEIIKEYNTPITMVDGEFLYVDVSLNAEVVNSIFTIGVPFLASVNVGTEIPIVEGDSPRHMYYEICRVEDGRIKQKICSDIWSGWKDADDDSSSSSSSGSDSSSSGSGSGSDSESSSSSRAPDDSSSSI